MRSFIQKYFQRSTTKTTTSRTDEPLNIGLLTIATGHYQTMVAPFYKSVEKFFFKSHRVQKFLFTDSRELDLQRSDVTVCPIPHLPWPLITLLRYHFFLQYRSLLQTMDVLFYCDVDMRMVAACGEEMLPDTATGLVGIQHPGFYAGRRGTYEKNPKSKAYIAPHEGSTYFCGGVNGGTTTAFLAMVEELVNNINHDLRKNHIAVWHDESHLNRYFCNHPPKSLSPSYCYPQWSRQPFPKIILALEKNRQKFRTWQ